jgi:hypothetical protein
LYFRATFCFTNPGYRLIQMTSPCNYSGLARVYCMHFLCWQYSFVTPVTSLVVVKPNDTHAIGSEVNQPTGKIHLSVSVRFYVVCRYHSFWCFCYSYYVEEHKD